MAKKNLHSLMSGIIGSDNSVPSVPNTEKATASPASVPQITPQSNEPTTPRKPGRPKKNDGNDNTRATFVISAELLHKLKYISLMDQRLQSDVLGEALSLYVDNWERENGKIKSPKK